MRLLIATVLILCAFPVMAQSGFGLAGGSVGKVIVYGDSYNDAVKITNELNETGIEVVWQAARAGASSYNGSTNDMCDAGDAYDMDNCSWTGETQAIRVGGACRAYNEVTQFGTSAMISNDVCGTTGDPVSSDADHACCGTSNCVPTCLADAQVSPNDVCLIQFGTNDVGAGVDIAWTSGNSIFVDAKAGYEAMLVEADSVGIRCVVATSFPRRFDAYGDYRRTNQRVLADWIRDTLMPQYPTHRFVDLDALVDEYEAKYGSDATDALYESGTTGVHPSTAGYDWMGNILAQALVGLRNGRAFADVVASESSGSTTLPFTLPGTL